MEKNNNEQHPSQSKIVAILERSLEPDSNSDFAQYHLTIERPDNSPGGQWVFPAPRALLPVKSSFSQHHLNHSVAGKLLAHSPDVLIISGLDGLTFDLPRIANLLGIQVCFRLLENPTPNNWDLDTQAAWKAVLKNCTVVSLEYTANDSSSLLSNQGVHVTFSYLEAQQYLQKLPSMAKKKFDYSTYEYCLRNHPLLVEMQLQYVKHFKSSKSVLDLGCGSGVFLELLKNAGINAAGVERDETVVEYGRGMGLDITPADALEFLKQPGPLFSGIYCSHFVEHLPFAAVQEIIQLLFNRIEPNGVALLVFPDPESIRSQLFGFWRDPEHVRYYHSDLITAVAQSVGFELNWCSHDDRPHHIVPMPRGDLQLPPVGAAPELNDRTNGNDTLPTLAMVDGQPQSIKSELAEMREHLSTLTNHYNQLVEQNVVLGQYVTKLWDLNQTWAWDDNVAIRLRKPQ